ncbi:MAG: NAD(P)/FAD-dependent oxidoreductase [Candidatus Latescibacteria bacterium]|nr:NAD(P)/FAD-dependent oxidoreductase [Candidatus Latescibacterota bacterium]MBT4136913.1 NAD(P)/FAD-dependent oxidoreductase [Candidatus Latescibacterota bacterium]MBT5831819.1 NAD(P)/FAD-dependent oxidoreductase [Candidatus Latescibacterota bacterium]
MDIAIVGGGAAGFFAAIAAKENYPEACVVIFEKSNKLLAKVKVSGGGRCNVTNGCTSIRELVEAYPRGKKQLKKAFRIFNTAHTMQWFEDRGVPLMTEKDGRVFPASQNSQTIIDCFMGETERLDITIEMGCGIDAIRQVGDRVALDFAAEDASSKTFDKVIVATGGSPKKSGLLWLEGLGHQIVEPIPSLFTFNMPDESVTKLMGIAVEKTWVSIQGTKLKSDGPLLITHWGMSGPVILKLSAFGARTLFDLGYEFNIQVNWVQIQNQDVVMDELKNIVYAYSGKRLVNRRPYSLPERLWIYLLEKCDLSMDKKWGELGKSGMNRLVNVLTHDVYRVAGKTTFKEEFVTCGGVSLESIDFNTMQSKACKNLYFAGELMDVDGVTGGYNFQAAWTTGFIAGQLQ